MPVCKKMFQQALKAPLKVTCDFETWSGPVTRTMALEPAAFRDNQAFCKLDQQGLIHCNSLVIEY